MKMKNAAVILMIASICNVLVELANNEMINYRPISWLISLSLPVSLLFVSIALMKFKNGENTATDNGNTSSNTTSNQPMTSDEDKTVAILAYITLIGFIIAIVQHSSNKTKLGAYHLRQAVGFMITGIAMSIILVLIALPMLSMRTSVADYAMFIYLISFVIWIGLFVCLIISIINAASGRLKPAPIFGRLFEKWLINLFK
jgi:NADH:ubiquinone oxidoreductase subunit 2 (subunit N)